MQATRNTSRTGGPSASARTASPAYAALPGLSLAPMLGGAALIWAWVLTVLFILQPGFVGAHVQTCALGGCAAALAAFALADSFGHRGPEPSPRRGVEVAAWVVCAAVTVALFPAGAGSEVADLLPTAALDALWTLAGALAAYPLRRTHFLFCALARRLPACDLARLTSGTAVAASLLALLAAHTHPAAGTAFALAAVPLAAYLLPAGMPSLPGSAPLRARGNAGADGRQAAALLCGMGAVGATCGFHTVVGRIVYSGESQFNLVFLSVAAAGLICRAAARLAPGRGLRTAVLLSLAGCTVVFAPFLFLNAMPGNTAWEFIQDSLVLLSACALLPLFMGTARVSAGCGVARACASRPLAVLFCCFVLGWVAGQLAWTAGGLDGIAFKLSVTACIALLVGGILVLATAGADETDGEAAGKGAYANGVAGEPDCLHDAGKAVASGNLGNEGPSKMIDATCRFEDGSAQASDMSGATGSLVSEQPSGVSVETGACAREAAAERETAHMGGSFESEDGHLDNPSPMDGDLTIGAAGIPTRPATEAGTPSTPTDEGSGRDRSVPSNPQVDAIAWRFGLSEREHALLCLLAEGLSTQQAAERLCVSRNTVKSHTAHIYTKTGVHTRAELDELLAEAEGAAAEQPCTASTPQTPRHAQT